VPTYQYACTACGHRFDAVQSFSDASLTDCPECAGRLRKVFSSVGIVFKGSGFYRTDSRVGSGSSEKSSAEPAAASSSGKDAGSTSTESKKSDSSSTTAGSSSAGSSGSSGSSSGTKSSTPAAAAS
jgi:putative FmdB family regulatory protein